jgi:hypothetical protein
MAFPVLKGCGVNLFVLLDRPIPVCLDGMAGLYCGSHTNAVKVVHLAAGMCTMVKRRLRNTLLVLIGFGCRGHESVCDFAVVLVWSLFGSKVWRGTHTKERMEVVD